jgi:hypothetical protein
VLKPSWSEGLCSILLAVLATGVPRTLVDPAKLNAAMERIGTPSVLIFRETTVDLGVLVEGERRSHRFIARNTGTHPVVIRSVETSCSCSVPAWSQKPIPPQGSGYVDVEFDSTLKSGDQFKTLHIVTSEPHAAEALLTVTALVENPVIVSPDRIALPRSQPGEMARGSARIVLNSGITSLTLGSVVEMGHDAWVPLRYTGRRTGVKKVVLRLIVSR